jgi:outer membrane protein TolC
MLPDVDANASYLKSSNSVDQKYNNGNEIKGESTDASITNANVSAFWTVFDGLKCFNRKEKLSEISLQSEVQLKIQIEQTLTDIIATYYSIVKNQQLLSALRDVLVFSRDRVIIAERKLNNGSGSRLELLQVQTELNRQNSLEIGLESEIERNMVELKPAIGKRCSNNFHSCRYSNH